MILVAPIAIAADYCIKTGGGNDFDMEVTAASGNYINMTLLSKGATDASYGSAVVQGSYVYLGFTKNTEWATVAYRGRVSATSL
jgi:hypothetical protein